MQSIDLSRVKEIGSLVELILLFAKLNSRVIFSALAPKETLRKVIANIMLNVKDLFSFFMLHL
jgi:hypothetical protein